MNLVRTLVPTTKEIEISRKIRLVLWLVIALFAIYDVPRIHNLFITGGHPDYSGYWASGRIFLSRGNPYDKATVLSAEQNIGWTGVNPFTMWSPPWTYILLLPFLLLPFSIGRLIWFLFSLVWMAWTADFFWIWYGGPPRKRHIAWLAVLLFVPSALSLNIGQISPLLIAGIALFLWSLDRRRDWLAGIFLLPLSTKPQAVYLFLCIMGLWIFQLKRYKVLYGFAVSLGLCVLACIAINPGVFKFFLHGLRSDYGPYIWQTPTLTALLRTLFPEHDAWLRYMLPCVGVVLASVLWLAWRKRLNWQHHLIPILLISLLTTTYGWTFDLVLLLPLAIIMAVRFNQEPRRQWPWFAGLVAVQMVMLVVMFSAKNYFVLFWVAPLLAMLYWLSSRSLSVDVNLERGA